MQPLQPRGERPALDHPLREALRRLEERASTQPATLPVWNADCDVAESEGELTIRIALEGFRREDVRVRVAEDLITVEADRRRDGARRDLGLVRSFLLPHPVPAEAVDAVLREGTLTVRVDKRRRARSRRVSIS